MGMLDKLKIVALAKQVKGTVEQERRKKLAEQLTEQLKLAEAALGGVAYQRTKAAWDTDAAGDRYRVQRPVKLRAAVVDGWRWWRGAVWRPIWRSAPATAAGQDRGGSGQAG